EPLRCRARARSVQRDRGAESTAASRDRRSGLQGERRRGHRGEADRCARTRAAGHHGAATATRAGTDRRYGRGRARMARRPGWPRTSEEDVMMDLSARRLAGVALALLALTVVARADLALFSKYWNNV